MKLSVALCTYNGEKFLRQQLDSIAGQALLPDELVVCDDRSRDSTVSILEEFSKQAPFPVHIFQNETNLGSTKNFERAISLCNGEIIALCDQDDVWKTHKLQRITDEFRVHPEAGYVFSDAELVNAQRQSLGKRLWDSIGFHKEIRHNFVGDKQLRCFAKQHIVTGATMAFRASVGQMAMPFPTIGNFIHDGWIALVASAMGSYGVPIEEPLIEYRQHSRQQIGAPEAPQAIKKRKSLLSMYRDLKINQEILLSGWEANCLRFLVLKDILEKLEERCPTDALRRNLIYFQAFETHYRNRKKILTTKDLKRYRLIFQEAFSGRYSRFADSWRSIFRDLFL